MKFPRRQFLQLVAGAAALPAISRLAFLGAAALTIVNVASGSVFGGITLALWMSTPSGAQQPMQEVKRCIEGAYVLEEFKLDGEVFKAPQIVGRFVVLNGTVTYVFHDRTKQATQTTYVGIGKYTATASGYAYGYDDYSTYTHAATGTTVSRRLPFEGMRLYAPALESDGMHLRLGQQHFHCNTPDGVTFNFGAGNYRRYRRTAAE